MPPGEASEHGKTGSKQSQGGRLRDGTTRHNGRTETGTVVDEATVTPDSDREINRVSGCESSCEVEEKWHVEAADAAVEQMGTAIEQHVYIRCCRRRIDAFKKSGSRGNDRLGIATAPTGLSPRDRPVRAVGPRPPFTSAACSDGSRHRGWPGRGRRT